MPTLHKANDGHFVVRTRRVHFETLQITDAGVAYLHQRGVEAEQDFPLWMLRELDFLGQIYTHGIGEHTDNEEKTLIQQFVRSDPFPWQFKLLSPPVEGYISLGSQKLPFYPAGYKKIPIIPRGREVLVEIAPTTSSKGAFTTGEICILRNNFSQVVATLPIIAPFTAIHSGTNQHAMPRYLEFALSEQGSYLLSEKTGQIKPLMFLAVPSENMTNMVELEALKIYIQHMNQPTWLSALEITSDETQPYEIFVNIGKGEIPSLTIACPVPLDLSWSDGFVSSMKRGISAEQAASFLSDPLATALRKKRSFTLCLDAGTFGHLYLRLASLITAQAQEERYMTLSPELLHRLRWLSTVTRTGKRSGGQAVVLSEKIRAVFAQMSGLPECAQLARLTSLPLELLPHVHALARAIERQSK